MISSYWKQGLESFFSDITGNLQTYFWLEDHIVEIINLGIDSQSFYLGVWTTVDNAFCTEYPVHPWNCTTSFVETKY